MHATILVLVLTSTSGLFGGHAKKAGCAPAPIACAPAPVPVAPTPQYVAAPAPTPAACCTPAKKCGKHKMKLMMKKFSKTC